MVGEPIVPVPIGSDDEVPNLESRKRCLCDQTRGPLTMIAQVIVERERKRLAEERRGIGTGN